LIVAKYKGLAPPCEYWHPTLASLWPSIATIQSGWNRSPHSSIAPSSAMKTIALIRTIMTVRRTEFIGYSASRAAAGPTRF
jgi:hypothetical protein